MEVETPMNITISTHSERAFSGRAVGLAALTVMVISAVLYGFTAFRTITWWDSTEYSLAAVGLGVAHPPGSLLLTLLGWLVVQLPLGISKAFSLNLFAGLLAAATSGLVCLVTAHLFRRADITDEAILKGRMYLPALFGIATAGFSFAFSETLWLFAVKFTPYVLTALFTGLIVLMMVLWWKHSKDKKAVWWLLLAAVLFGLDFSVHRTNLLMLPGLFFVVLLRHPKTFLSGWFWLCVAGGFVAGLAVNLLLIPIAAADPFINVGDPATFSRYWDYVSLKLYGGGFLANVLQRKAPFWSYQVSDWIRVFGANFCNWHGRLGIIGVLPALLGITGFGLLWLRNWRLAASLTVLFLLASFGAIVYFNIPENFFRTMDRHYLPSLVIFAVWIAYGAGSIMAAATFRGAGFRPLVAALVVLAAPAEQIVSNCNRVDGSGNYFTYDYAVNVMSTLPPDAVIFTSGDTDTWPLLYLQGAEGVRTDVTLLNLSLMNTFWFMEQMISQDRDLPLSLDREELMQLRPRIGGDTILVIPVEGEPSEYGLADTVSLPDSLLITMQPSLQGKVVLNQDQLLVDIIRENGWRRPIYFSNRHQWLAPHLRMEGLAWRLVPLQSVENDEDILRKNLLREYSYRGYADSSLPMEFTTRNIAINLTVAFLMLASTEAEKGNYPACMEIRQRMLRLLPPERAQPPAQITAAIESVCLQGNQMDQE
jgi:hypothetical protein